jgi:hypothetical protein
LRLSGLTFSLSPPGSIRIDGSTDPAKRYDFVKMFNTDESTRVAILSMTAAGVGLTLTAACHVIFAELFWNPGTLLQCEDRAHRIGQKRAVTIQYIVAKDTFDEQLWELIEKKMGILGTIFDGVLDTLGAENANNDEDDAAASAPNEIPVDDSLMKWILQKAFSWDERRKKAQQRAARRAAVENEDNQAGDVVEYAGDHQPVYDVEMQDEFDQALMAVDLSAYEEPDIEIEVDEATPPEYIPEETAQRLSHFAFHENSNTS